MTTKRILVPIDGSAHSEKTLVHACALAKDLAADLMVLQVIDTPFFAGYPYDLMSVKSDLRKIKDTEYEQVRPRLEESGLQWTREIEHGAPAETIIAVAEQGKYDLIVIGSHGASAGERFLLGSVSDRVVHHAPCDVYVVK